MKIGRVAKAIVAAATFLGSWVATAGADGHFTATEIAVGLSGVVIATFAVWAVPNSK